MADGGAQTARRYSAFLSYSREDSRFVRRLHRQLEAYRLPSNVARSSVEAAGRRLKPVFLDNDELVAAHDLTEAVRDALGQSDHLIVVCSPRSAKSKWVGREIELFRHLHGDKPILTALIDGEPDDAFHPALRRRPHGRAIQPLAADFRPHVGAGRLARLKLIAGLAGVGLDDLIHRDGQRRLRQLATASAGAVAASALIAALALAALNAHNEAAMQARRANGLGDFMVSDLRKGLEAAGRHDLLKQVNEAALRSYQAEDFSKLTPEQALQFAKGLQGAAKDDEKAGDLQAARENANRAYRITAALLAAKPNEPQRIFAHAQSEYWSGFVSWRQGDGEAAKARFKTYAHLADRLVASDPKNDEWRMEKVYAANNLGSFSLRHDADAATAETYFRSSLNELDTIVQHKPGDFDVLLDRANALGWLADCQRLQARLSDASATRELQRRFLNSMLANDPRNHEVKWKLLGYQLAAARIAEEDGELARAASLLSAGYEQAQALANQDPDNKDLPKQARMFELFKVKTWLERPAGQRPAARVIAETLGNCAPTGPGAVNAEISDFCNVLLGRFRASQGDNAGAIAALAQVKAHAADRHDILTARWGLDLAAEARPVQLAMGGAR